MDYKNISLIGFMGSGKTTVGKILAERLNFLFIDLDKVIEIAEDKTISEIFKYGGEKYFRDVESEVIKKIYINEHCVFACGGGIVERKENMDFIKKMSIIVYLSISPGQAFERLKNVEDRPLLGNSSDLDSRKKIINNLINKRDVLYKNNSNFKINTDYKSPECIAEEIMKKL
ncbi:MAG: shikimate kinase [Actinobacteria bacterium]|nr:shikimate kinase [Actinomycetota bacterium]